MQKMMDMTVDNNKIVAEWKETKYIVLSSSFFMVPAIYGFYNNLYLLPCVLVLTSLFSMNFWRHATYSWRRIADRIFAKISFTIFFINGVRHVSHLISVYTGLCGILYCYYMSQKCNNVIWWKYHMMFHIFVAYNQLIIINSIVTKY